MTYPPTYPSVETDGSKVAASPLTMAVTILLGEVVALLIKYV